MEDHLKVSFSKRLGFGAKPEDLPARYVEFYDKLGAKWKSMLSNSDPKRDEWPLIVVLTDAFDKQREIIEGMEGRIKALESVNKPHMALEVQYGEPDPAIVDVPAVPRKEHWKTRQARERQAAVMGA